MFCMFCFLYLNCRGQAAEPNVRMVQNLWSSDIDELMEGKSEGTDFQWNLFPASKH